MFSFRTTFKTTEITKATDHNAPCNVTETKLTWSDRPGATKRQEMQICRYHMRKSFPIQYCSLAMFEFAMSEGAARLGETGKRGRLDFLRRRSPQIPENAALAVFILGGLLCFEIPFRTRHNQSDWMVRRDFETGQRVLIEPFSQVTFPRDVSSPICR